MLIENRCRRSHCVQKRDCPRRCAETVMLRRQTLRRFVFLLSFLPVTMANSFINTPGVVRGDITGSAALEWTLPSEPRRDDLVGFTFNGADVFRYEPYTGIIPPPVVDGPGGTRNATYDPRFSIYNSSTRGVGFRLAGLWPEDAGTYTCRYESLSPAITTDAVLFVYDVPGKPIIEASPQILVEGVTVVSLVCGVSSTSLPVAHRPTMLYTLSRNGVDIDSTGPPERHAVLGDRGQFLEISPVHHTDTTYTCTASESGTKLASEATEVTLDVKHGPYSLIISPKNPSARENESLEITASADCNPVCSFTWSIGDDVISQGPILRFDRFQSQDANNYTVRAENIYGTADFTVDVTLATVDGNGPYNLTIYQGKPSAKEGDPFEIMASADCNPVCSFTWSMGDDVISQGPILRFDRFQCRDANNYTVRAANIFGTADLTVEVTLGNNLAVPAGPRRADDVIIGVVSTVACVSLIMNVVFIIMAFRRGLFSCRKGNLEPGNPAAVYVNADLVREPGKPAANYVNAELTREQVRSLGNQNQDTDMAYEVVTPTHREPTHSSDMQRENGLDDVPMTSGGHPVVVGVYEPVDHGTRDQARPADKVYAALRGGSSN